VPPARVAIMRAAMEATFKDPGFMADAKRMALGVNTPKTGEQIQKLIGDAYRAPPQVISRLRKLSLH
jgi:hypothetical protein